MSGAVTLTLREAPPGPLELDGLTPDRCAELGEREIAALDLWSGRERLALGDLFAVRGGRTADLRLAGDLAGARGVGAAMRGGHLVVDGDAGDEVGREMTGGTLEVSGTVGDDAGAGMAGGTLVVGRGAGARLGGALPGAPKGMTGGEIVVRGDAGPDAGAYARRGVIAVGGSAGPGAAHAMIAGTLVVLGDVAAGAALFLKRGSLVALGSVAPPPTFRLACTYRPPHVALLLTYLRRRYGFPAGAERAHGRYDRWTGDLGGEGRGEILHWRGTA